MQKLSLGVAARLIAVFIVLACSAAPARAGYFDGLYACDNNYYGTLGDCRNSPYYPYSPDESQCRYNAGDAYMTCINSIMWGPMPQLDFCDQARAARDNCVNTYLLDEDYDAYYACWNATGINQCE